MWEQAACRDFDPIYWHPPEDSIMPGRHPRVKRDPRFAYPKEICESCPERKPCLIASKGARGIWGGLDVAERYYQIGSTWTKRTSPPTASELDRVEKVTAGW